MFDSENEIDPRELPIYKKGWEIYEVVDRICQLIPEDDEMLGQVKSIILEDAMMLTVKVAGAEAGQLYDIKMEAFLILRESGRLITILTTIFHLMGTMNFSSKNT